MQDKVLIVGSGVAALAAAFEAKRHGQEVTMVVSHPGASAMMSGAWDVARDPHREASDAWKDIKSAREVLSLIALHNPLHPYAIMSGSNAVQDLGQFLEEGVLDFSHDIQLPLKGSMEYPHLAITCWGTVKETSFLPNNIIGGDILRMERANLLVIGLDDSLNFNANFIAESLQSLQAAQQGNFFAEIHPATMNLNRLETMTPFEWARWLESDEGQEIFLNQLNDLIAKHQPTHILLPPVMGMEGHQEFFLKIQEIAEGRHCFETLSVPPSVHGWRLQYLMAQAVESHKISMVHGDVTGFQKTGNILDVALVETGKEKIGIPFDLAVLATGRFMGQGLKKKNSIFHEPLCDLPLFNGTEKVVRKFAGHLTRPTYFENQPIFSVGLKVNKNMQPVNELGQVCYDNLWVAGSMIGGYSAMGSGCGMGLAIGTGKLAGQTRGQ
jgi:glycerol-3-phosphate dehydrogenase subunit B